MEAHPCNSSFLRVMRVVAIQMGIGKHLSGEVWRQLLLHLREAIGTVHAEDLGRLV